MGKKNDNVINVEFGTQEPNISEMTEEEKSYQEYLNGLYLTIGRSTLDWAIVASKEDYIAHMMELYNSFHTEQKTEQSKSKIEVPEKKIILPT